MAQSLFVLMIISSIQICCVKKKKKKKKKKKINAKTANETDMVVNARKNTADNTAQMAKETNLRKSKDERKRDDQTQAEEGSEKSDEERADIIPMNKVENLGNIDEVRKENKLEMEKAAEEIKSIHEMDDQKPFNVMAYSNLHVKIKENKCKLYETNDEPTIDEEVEDPLI
ncbi:unnamed protein product [Cercopithifilaria johnstoni]|uniref:Uncharacterized protein n=1 Tax=Cercopithifilaria johnstoni TaxID=2874296 RepID=A0A8J2MRA6_9BILA|nr:unnamed protein product [Cercopithifilaria johnstoni]